jgi:hypothetical protein
MCEPSPSSVMPQVSRARYCIRNIANSSIQSEEIVPCTHIDSSAATVEPKYQKESVAPSVTAEKHLAPSSAMPQVSRPSNVLEV